LFGGGLEMDLANTTTSSVVLQTALDVERAVCNALETHEGV
jgi:hypothetical protein